MTEVNIKMICDPFGDLSRHNCLLIIDRLPELKKNIVDSVLFWVYRISYQANIVNVKHFQAIFRTCTPVRYGRIYWSLLALVPISNPLHIE